MPALAASGAGRVVAVSTSNVHKIEMPTFAPASSIVKAALETVIKCFALQLAPSGATVNAVVPGFTRKGPGKPGALSRGAWIQAARRTPTGRLNETDDVAAAIEFPLHPWPGRSPARCCRSAAASRWVESPTSRKDEQ